jgi:transposase
MYYMGVDHHMQSSHMTVIDGRGHMIKSGRVLNRRKEIETFLEGIALTELEAVIESGRASYTMIAHLESLGVKVKMAHALQLKAIAQAKIKTDKRDARMLAHLLRSDLIPEVYLRNAENRQAQRVLRHRVFHVRMQSRVKNRIRALLANQTEEEVQDLSHWERLFTKKGLELLKEIDLPGEDGPMLASLIRIIGQLSVEIRTSGAMIRLLFKNSSQARLISTVPGFGKFFSVLVATEIADIKRFASPAKLHSYAGVIPSTYASGDRSYHGRLVRQGNKWLRWAAVEAVWPARKADHDLNVLYLSLVKRKGANSAKIVLARRLLTIIYRILKDERVYVPFKRD